MSGVPTSGKQSFYEREAISNVDQENHCRCRPVDYGRCRPGANHSLCRLRTESMFRQKSLQSLCREKGL
jgi:hypothetical protein